MPYDATAAPAEVAEKIAARERLMRLRDHIAGLPPEMFDVDEWPSFHAMMHAGCGTAACIGGWAQALYHARTHADIGDILGLTRDQVSRLFYPHELPDDYDWSDITPTQAVRVLDHLLTTEDVDWNVRGEP